MCSKLNLFGFRIESSTPEIIVEDFWCSSEVVVINTINPHSYVVSKKDLKFRKALLTSDVLIPDGSGIVLAIRYLFRKKIKKVSGFDLFIATMNKLQKENGKVFFFGSTEDVLSKIKLKCKREYPNIEVETFAPPFKTEFSSSEIEQFIQYINNFSPNVLFIGMTAPKQEKLILDIKNRLYVNMISGVGAVFDFYAETVKRPSDVWISLHLEWLIRFIREPKRLWRRNFISSPIFLFDILKEKFKN